MVEKPPPSPPPQNTIKLELQIVSEMLRANTGSSCVFPSRLLGSWAVFRIVMRATNEGH